MVEKVGNAPKTSKIGFGATADSFVAMSETSRAIATEMADYSKRSFENSIEAIEKWSGVKSWDQAIEVQREYATAAYEDYAAEVSKLGKLYADLAKDAFKPYGREWMT